MKPLHPEHLLAEAERATGLRDWGGEEYFEREFRALLTAMVHSLEHEAALTEQGHRGAELRLAAALEARLGFIADRTRWPEIKREQIVRPMFILGLPRSGSTFLHSLMAQDPANRVPLTWEMMLPSPPPTCSRSAQRSTHRSRRSHHHRHGPAEPRDSGRCIPSARDGRRNVT